MRHASAALLLAVWLAFLPSAWARPPELPVPIVIGTEYAIDSKVLGEERRILVALPPGYEGGTRRYPVLYLLDGDGHFHHVTGIVRFLEEVSRIPPMIVVGVTNTQRTRDLTPPATGEDVPRGAGGADAFLRFLGDELAPTLEARYRTHPYRILVGHSYGGLFALHALMNSPQRFNAYIAISPSLWWNKQELVRNAAKSLERPSAQERALYMTVGNEGGEMLDPIQELVRTLEKAKPAKLAWRYAYLENDHHATTPLRTVHDGLEFIFAGWEVPQPLIQSGNVEAIDAHYAAMTQRFGFEVRPPEATLNFMGYERMRKGEHASAVALLRKAVALYGKTSANAHDSLGEALEAAGKKDEAAASYLRAWKLGTELGDPNVSDYKQHLDRALGKEPAAKK